MTNKPMIMRIFSYGLILLGIYYFLNFALMLMSGTLLTNSNINTGSGTWPLFWVILLTIPLPIHLIAAGLFLRRNLMTLGWARMAKILIIGSGLWLGAAFIIKISL